MSYTNNAYVQTKYFNYYAMVVIYALLLLPFMSLSGVQQIMGQSAYSAYQSAAMVLLFVLFLFKVRYIPKDAFSWLFLAFNALVFYSTIQNYGFSMGILVNILAYFFVVLLIQRDAELIIRALAVIAVVALMANFISLFRWGISDRVEYFVGGKNSMSIFLIPSAFLVMADAYLRKGKSSWWVFCYAALVTLTVFLTRSATGIVTAIAMCAGMLWIKKFKPNVVVVMIVMILAQAVLVFLIDFLSALPIWARILNWLGKEETLTSRAFIWDQTIEIVKKNWLLGAGRGVVIRYTNSWGGRSAVSEAHNFFLELLLEGGIVGVFLYVSLLLSAVKKLNMDSMQHRIFFICFVVILVNGLAEAANNKIYVSIVLGLLSACSNNVVGNDRLRRRTEETASD